MKNFTSKLIGMIFILGAITPLQASVIPVDSGFEVSYGINMSPGTSNGGDIEKMFLFEWNDSQFNVDYSYSVASSGNTFLSHVIPFAPTSALAVGYVPGITGIGDGKDHIYMITNDLFAANVIGLRWSEIFPGTDAGRLRHSELVALLIGADAGDAAMLALLTDFITTEAYIAAFDPSDDPFTVLEFSVVEPPVGGNIPEPATIMLMGLGLAGLGFGRNRKAA